MEASDAVLAARARSGDGDAFRVLVERHGRKVFRLAYRLLGNEEDAEDIVQETFLRAFKSLDRFQDNAQFSTWIHAIASNRAFDLLRLRKRRRGEESLSGAAGGNGQPVSDRLASTEPGPDRIAAGSQTQDRIRIALDDLTPQERVAFTLRHFEGHTVEEVSASLNVSANATRNTVFRAVQKMRRALGPKEGEPSWRT